MYVVTQKHVGCAGRCAVSTSKCRRHWITTSTTCWLDLCIRSGSIRTDSQPTPINWTLQPALTHLPAVLHDVSLPLRIASWDGSERSLVHRLTATTCGRYRQTYLHIYLYVGLWSVVYNVRAKLLKAVGCSCKLSAESVWWCTRIVNCVCNLRRLLPTSLLVGKLATARLKSWAQQQTNLGRLNSISSCIQQGDMKDVQFSAVKYVCCRTRSFYIYVCPALILLNWQVLAMILAPCCSVTIKRLAVVDTHRTSRVVRPFHRVK